MHETRELPPRGEQWRGSRSFNSSSPPGLTVAFTPMHPSIATVPTHMAALNGLLLHTLQSKLTRDDRTSQDRENRENTRISCTHKQHTRKQHSKTMMTHRTPETQLQHVVTFINRVHRPNKRASYSHSSFSLIKTPGSKFFKDNIHPTAEYPHEVDGNICVGILPTLYP